MYSERGAKDLIPHPSNLAVRRSAEPRVRNPSSRPVAKGAGHHQLRMRVACRALAVNAKARQTRRFGHFFPVGFSCETVYLKFDHHHHGPS